MNLYKYPPIADVQNNTVFFANGNFCLAYRVHLPEVYSLSENDFDQLHSSWFQAIKSLPVGTYIHKQDVYLKKAYQAKDLPTKSFLQQATHNYFKGREHLDHQCLLFFSLPKNNKLAGSKYRNPFAALSKAKVDQSNQEWKHFERHVIDVVAYLNQSGKLKVHRMTAQEITAFSKDFWNGFVADYDTDIQIGSNALQLGNQYFQSLVFQHESSFQDELKSSRPHATFTADDFNFYQGFIDGFGLQLYEHHMVNQLLIIEDSKKWQRALEKRIESLKKSANFSSQNVITCEKLEAVLDTIVRDEQSRLVRGQFNVIFWHEHKEHLKEITGKLMAECKQLDIRPYLPSGQALPHYVLNSYFGFTSNFGASDTYVTDLKHALCLWLHTGNYQSDTTGIIFNDRQYNLPVKKDVWDEAKNRIKARNFAIFAPTGEGKSFLANNILRQYFEEQIRLVIIDLGGSYSKFAQLYPKEHLILRFEPGKSLGINPFYCDDGNPSPELLEELSVFLLELTAFDTNSKAQSVTLKNWLRRYYKNSPAPYNMYAFYNFLIHMGEKNVTDEITKSADKETFLDRNRFLHILSEYVGDGIYSYLFQPGKKEYRLEDKRLIIFELDEVRDNKEILAVMLKLIKTAVQRSIWSKREEKGIILFDEFAKQLKFPNVLESVEFYYQAIRKQNGAIGIILQSINQLPHNSTAASILENTQVIYSLRNEKGYEELVSRLKLSSHDHNQLKSITNKLSGKQKYTEVFIKIGRQSNVYRLEVPPEAYAAYLTDGKENEEILRAYRKLGNMEKAITQFLSKPSS
ncbi:TraG family conjugative transposon ATPase [Zunongwangia endophytica]|uniref:TraG family conjugative transposon ATPase n=1 Tax=Zunongwangia endophytica TaxID=1808945 RepID=A0ABV8HBZ8_9FLAO|nr:TraG family conjugative transposon ATPase [Zunongwangia endophytica]MDN3594374.1 TraG family conjugative transposon ATPase [Zunongwangia endophytica]